MNRSHEAAEPRRDKEEVATILEDCAFKLHQDLGPGLLESVYEVVLTKLLQERGLTVERQKPVPIQYAGCTFEEGFRADLIVDGVVLVELKSVENLAAVHAKQVLTYLRLMKLPLGLLINFGAATFKEGCQRIVNGPQSFVSPCEPGLMSIKSHTKPADDRHREPTEAGKRRRAKVGTDRRAVRLVRLSPKGGGGSFR